MNINQAEILEVLKANPDQCFTAHDLWHMEKHSKLQLKSNKCNLITKKLWRLFEFGFINYTDTKVGCRFIRRWRIKK